MAPEKDSSFENLMPQPVPQWDADLKSDPSAQESEKHQMSEETRAAILEENSDIAEANKLKAWDDILDDMAPPESLDK